ncbi:hypothetical protein L1987_87133 [Smallanthus sonchifolius]|nr:hypothetical protein L1987_87133 [Smallanthus sonchifolius]
MISVIPSLPQSRVGGIQKARGGGIPELKWSGVDGANFSHLFHFLRLSDLCSYARCESFAGSMDETPFDAIRRAGDAYSSTNVGTTERTVCGIGFARKKTWKWRR